MPEYPPLLGHLIWLKTSVSLLCFMPWALTVLVRLWWKEWRGRSAYFTLCIKTKPCLPGDGFTFLCLHQHHQHQWTLSHNGTSWSCTHCLALSLLVPLMPAQEKAKESTGNISDKSWTHQGCLGVLILVPARGALFCWGEHSIYALLPTEGAILPGTPERPQVVRSRRGNRCYWLYQHHPPIKITDPKGSWPGMNLQIICRHVQWKLLFVSHWSHLTTLLSTTCPLSGCILGRPKPITHIAPYPPPPPPDSNLIMKIGHHLGLKSGGSFPRSASQSWKTKTMFMVLSSLDVSQILPVLDNKWPFCGNYNNLHTQSGMD